MLIDKYEWRYSIKNKGLTGFQLKLIGLILMVLDHIYYFFNFKNIPIVFTWAGRIVAPLFMFTAVEGYYYTRSKKKYMLRLYIGFIFMNIGNNLALRYLPRPDNILVINNIFSTLLLVTIYISILNFMEKSIEEENKLKKILSIILLLMPLIIDKIISLNPKALMKFRNVIPSITTTEGGSMFILIGICMYFYRKDRKRQLFVYSLLTLPFIFIGDTSLKGLFFQNYQWMMIFAAPLLYLYNGKKGRGMKYLFYIFYPVHIYGLYIISVYILTM